MADAVYLRLEVFHVVFINVFVSDVDDFSSLSAAREKGLVGMEGKDYVVKDGDVILFRFNV